MRSNADPTSVVLRCTAQMRSGSFCDAPGMLEAPFPIRDFHADKLMKHLGAYDAMMRERLRSIGSMLDERPLDLSGEERKNRARKQALADQSQVYYVRIGDHVKIGYTTNVRQRMNQLRVDVADVLATEPGGVELEKARHEQFDAERVGRREEFNPSRRLLAHIDAIKAQHGEPNITYYPKLPA